MAAPEKKSDPQQTLCLQGSEKEVFEPPVSIFQEFLILFEVGSLWDFWICYV